ncbi:hypothetical protein G6M87_06015 [Rhizobium rhizogenes]|uniref:hypothetical protein n=1 Tax=Rhizobium TaxID=379 RepID=UPI00026ED052|nr:MULTISPECIES: hypothetical protein [Rhizobium]OCJ24917.1 hypothetical protein A6U88_00040 [Agrobacterium sp. B131/95]EJK83510.1 hypothetical protein PMI03_03165 [Rhizobium sp. AP16]KEA07703.1 hypothetical protein CN09_12510 [Rhizobium rhizogenes]MDJ1633060.1 hypothetical protein [Rhizobium rhizogenes]MQB28880.1 hypothetical protein [Rhizobium rhizogenes]
MTQVAAAKRLDHYLGTWDVTRRIIDRLKAPLIIFEGQALLTPVQFGEHDDTTSDHATAQEPPYLSARLRGQASTVSSA